MKEQITKILKRTSVPDPLEYLKKVEDCLEVLTSEEAPVRPRRTDGGPGGIINLLKGIPTIIVPDLHARMNLIGSLVNLQSEEGGFYELMAEEKLQVLCVGDGFHRELDAKERWQDAFREYEKGFKKHVAMDEEMRESLGLMEMIMELKCAFPRNFHFLKGNHENIGNEEGGGNHPFRKFAYEGDMVRTWVLQFMGEEFLNKYSVFEKLLPLLAIGENFLVSHAEPLRFFSEEEVTDYTGEAVHGLTWTANGEAEEGGVRQMLDIYLPEDVSKGALYLGGHRIITEKYRLRAGGDFVQIHNPWKYQIVFLKPGCPIDLEKDIIEIPGKN
ncbi:MAG: metallophosphoesterase [Spirochaetales bacterium]|nr:metallophosphoesterase [Spirochaetales bacterium]